MKLWGMELSPGEKRRDQFTVNESIQLPLWLIEGAAPGPALVVTAGVHGCEYVGVLAAKALYEQIDVSALKGRVAILPMMNEQGCYQGVKRTMPQDGKNLNRVFPGCETGTYSEQIAHALVEQIYPQADFLIDLHGGDVNEAMKPLVFFSRMADDTLVNRCREAAACLKVEYRIPSTSVNGLYSCAVQCGVPALLLEIGGQGRWEASEIQRCVFSVHSLMGYLQMTGSFYTNKSQREAAETVYDEAAADGLWYPRITAGQEMLEGSVLGVLEDIEGNELQTVVTRFAGVILYHTVSMGVGKGDALVAYARFA